MKIKQTIRTGIAARGTAILAALSLALVFLIASALAIQSSEQPDVELKAAMHKELVNGDLEGAIAEYKNIVTRPGMDRAIASKALLQMGKCYEKLGDEGAKKAYEQLLRDYSDQKEVAAEARERLAALEKPPGGNNRGRLMVRQVWNRSAGSVSPNGRYITFVNDLNLAVHDLVTGKDTRLTSFGSPDTGKLVEHSVFSPDGKQIAYDSYNGVDMDTWDLCVIGLDGSGSRVLVHRVDKDFIWPIAWSPDGKRILTAFFRQESSGTTGEITFVSIEDGFIQTIKPTHKTALSTIREMSVSPDGRYIAYHAAAAEDSKQNDLFLLSSDGSRDFPLIQHPANDYSPAWTPDGKKIIFVSDRGGTAGLWMIDVEDGKPKGDPVLVKADIGQFDGRIGLTCQGAYYYTLSTTRRDVYTADLDPKNGKLQGEPKILSSRIIGANSEPAWSPNGQYLAFYRQHGSDTWAPDANKIVIHSVRTGEERELPSIGIQFGRVRWFPDGRSFLVSVFRAEKDWRIDYYRVDVTTGKSSLILKREAGGGTPWPGLSPDGSTIFFTGEGWVRSYQIETRQEKELYRRSPGQRVRKSLRVSPDGRHLAFVEYEMPYPPTSVVKIVPTERGEARELLRVPWTAGFIDGNGSLEWSPDGHYLFIVKQLSRPTGAGELWRIPVAGGEPQKLQTTTGLFRSPSIHPDGNRIAFSALSRSSESETWVMENFLPTQ
jgi:Tol biopolymer transport system component